MNAQFILTIATLVVAFASVAISVSTLAVNRRERRDLRESGGTKEGSHGVTSDDLGAPPPEQASRRSSHLGKFSVALTVFAGTVGAAAVTVATLQFSQESSPPPPLDVNVVIVEPQDGQVVTEAGFPLRGTVTDLPLGTTMWFLTREDGTASTFQPASRPCGIDPATSQFSCGTVYVGGQNDSGARFTVYLVVADAAATAQFLEYDASNPADNAYPGLAGIPSGATIVEDVGVIRE